MITIHVRLGMTPAARGQLTFAARFAEALDAPLFVWTSDDQEVQRLLPDDSGIAPGNLEKREVRAYVHAALGRANVGIVPEFAVGDPWKQAAGPDAIVIGSRDAPAPVSASLIATMGEAGLRARGEGPWALGGGPICVPIGKGDSGRAAAAHVLPMAAKLGLPIMFYHTTWKNPYLPEKAHVTEHVLPEVLEILDGLRAEATTLGVRNEAHVATAPDIVEGLVRFALFKGCTLIAMARSAQVGRGSHVDQVLARSVIPVLVVGRSTQ